MLRLLGLLIGDLEHDLVVHEQHRPAVDAGLLQSSVHRGERQHADIRAGTLDRCIAAQRVFQQILGPAVGSATGDVVSEQIGVELVGDIALGVGPVGAVTSRPAASAFPTRLRSPGQAGRFG